MDSDPLPESLIRKQNKPVEEAMFITVSSLMGMDKISPKSKRRIQNGRKEYLRAD